MGRIGWNRVCCREGRGGEGIGRAWFESMSSVRWYFSVMGSYFGFHCVKWVV